MLSHTRKDCFVCSMPVHSADLLDKQPCALVLQRATDLSLLTDVFHHGTRRSAKIATGCTLNGPRSMDRCSR